MRRVIVQEWVTVDGFAAGENNELDFMSLVESNSSLNSLEKNQLEFIETVDTMLLGLNTYKLFEAYWPMSKDNIAPGINALNKYVCSETLEQAPWGNLDSAVLIQKNTEKEIANLKAQTGKDIVIWGSLTLVQSLFNSDIIDEYQFIVCPSILGKGKKVFTEDSKLLNMTLLESKTFDGGCVLLRYAR